MGIHKPITQLKIVTFFHVCFVSHMHTFLKTSYHHHIHKINSYKFNHIHYSVQLSPCIYYF